MNQVIITVKQARGLLLIAPKNDVRYYLNGIKVEFDGGRIAATDGHRLIVSQGREAMHSDPAYDPCIVPRDALYNVVKGGKATDTVSITFGESGVTLARENGVTMTVPAVDGKYPDIDRVIPKELSGEPAQFHWQYLADASKALNLCEDTDIYAPYLQTNGLGAAVMSSQNCPTFVVVMPSKPGAPSTQFVPADLHETA